MSSDEKEQKIWLAFLQTIQEKFPHPPKNLQESEERIKSLNPPKQ